MLRGGINELITNTDIPESQKEQLAEILRGIRLYKRADEHMEKIAEEIESLVGAGYTHIRTTKKEAVVNPIGGGSQTVKLSRSRQIPELNNQMNNRTVDCYQMQTYHSTALPRPWLR